MPDRLLIPGILCRHNPLIEPLPVFFDSPHSGRDYPADFDTAIARDELRQGEDAWVDELFAAAPEHGAVLLSALFPRSYVDVNRHIGEVDPALLGEPWPGAIVASDKVLSGVGLIWKLIGPGRPIYQRKLTVGEVQRRLERCYFVYLAEFDAIIERMHRRFGAVWHVNCHSMASLSGIASQDKPRPDFCIGTLDGASADRAFVDLVVTALRRYGYRVAIDDPFKGAELVRRHGAPAQGRHSLQIEINRRLYMEEATLRKHAGFDRLKAELGQLIAAIAAYARGNLVLRPPLAAE